MKKLSLFIALIAFAVAPLPPLRAENTSAAGKPGPVPHTILPQQFGGWRVQDSIVSRNDPSSADPVNTDVLKEYGFTDFERAAYVRDDGRTLKIKAARFQDASGAYGAFTYYKTPEMLNEKIGDQGYSLNQRVLFYRGNILVDAQFEKLSAMSAAELRELAGELPRPPGTT